MRVRHPKALQSVSVVNLAPARKLLFTVFVTVLYAAVFHQVYSTMGEPRVEAIAQANELRIKKLHELAEEQSIGDDSGGEADDDDAARAGHEEEEAEDVPELEPTRNPAAPGDA